MVRRLGRRSGGGAAFAPRTVRDVLGVPPCDEGDAAGRPPVRAGAAPTDDEINDVKDKALPLLVKKLHLDGAFFNRMALCIHRTVESPSRPSALIKG